MKIIKFIIKTIKEEWFYLTLKVKDPLKICFELNRNSKLKYIIEQYIQVDNIKMRVKLINEIFKCSFKSYENQNNNLNQYWKQYTYLDLGKNDKTVYYIYPKIN